uniref:SGNH/GDSL hydrolase family protein n=1 Tax=Desulfacinum infernum TaxID=35837 RepID=A0A832A2I8_9BACT
MKRWVFLGVLVLAWGVSIAAVGPDGAGRAWAGPALMVMGDSLGEGVQSADANLRTQPNSYAVWVARRAGINLTLPYIVSGPLGVVGDVSGRYRLFPYTASNNLAVSGADSWSILNDRALATSPRSISTETELVLFPRIGSQIEIVEDLKPQTVLCWIGSNDVLSAVLAFDELHETQILALMTDPTQFEENYKALLTRLSAVTSKVVLADIADVTNIGFLLSNEDLNRFLGPGDYLPEGSRTTIVALFLIRLGMADSSLFQDPHYVLDAEETEIIRERTAALNAAIYRQAAGYGYPVVKISEKFREKAQNPPIYAGVPLSMRYLGGFFSLDGVHPSNIGHALVANEFLSVLESQYGWSAPPLTEAMLNDIAASDPFVDLDGDGRVQGRPLAGALETLGPLLGISGDVEEPSGAKSTMAIPEVDPEKALSFLDGLRDPAQRGSKLWTQDEIRSVFRKMFRP